MADQVDVAAAIYDRIVDMAEVDGLDNEQIHGIAWEAAGALHDAGYRVVKQEQVGWTDTGADPDDTPADWYFRYEDDQVGDEARPVWRDAE